MSESSSSGTPLAWASEAIGADTLEAQGLALIQNLSHQQWSDYNDHDPGITTIEQLAYVLSDLSYRSVMPVPGLLAAEVSSAGSSWQSTLSPAPFSYLKTGILEYLGFHPWRTILPSAVVSPADWRKVLMNIPAVRNAWLDTPLSASSSSSSSLSAVSSSSSDRSAFSRPGTSPSSSSSFSSSSSSSGGSASSVGVQPGYQVTIEQHPADLGGNLSDADEADQINYLAANLLGWTRPLGDTFRVFSLMPRWIRIRLTVHLLSGAAVSPVQDAIIQRLIARIQPEPETISGEKVPPKLRPPEAAGSPGSTSSSSASELPLGELVDGPPLGYGFIDERKLSHVTRRVTLRRGDLLKELLQPPIPGVAGITDVAILNSPMLSLSSFSGQPLLPFLQRFVPANSSGGPKNPVCSYVESRLSLITRQQLQHVPPAGSTATLDLATQQAIAIPLLTDLNTVINGPSLLSMGFAPASSSGGASSSSVSFRTASSLQPAGVWAELPGDSPTSGLGAPVQESNRLTLQAAYAELPRYFEQAADETSVETDEVFHFAGIQGAVVNCPPRGQPTRSRWDWATSPQGWNNSMASHPFPTSSFFGGAGLDVSAYSTVWNEFPLTYGIGENGLPGTVTVARQAQARQFQGYLVLCDQLMLSSTLGS